MILFVKLSGEIRSHATNKILCFIEIKSKWGYSQLYNNRTIYLAHSWFSEILISWIAITIKGIEICLISENEKNWNLEQKMKFHWEWRRSESKRRYDLCGMETHRTDILTREGLPLPIALSSKVRMEAAFVSELSSYEMDVCSFTEILD